jgi:hypothetical protein
MSEYKSFPFMTAADALAEIRRQHLAGEPLVWKGPDRLHYSIAATCPEPSHMFSPEGLAGSEEQGQDFWDVYTMIAFQLGYHNGVLSRDKDVERLRDDVLFWKRMLARAEEGEKHDE